MWKFGKRSWSNLEFVRPQLVAVCTLGLERSPLDFGVIDGRRTIEEQQDMIDSGASKLKNPQSSRHVPDPSVGLANAVDIMVYVNGQGRWDTGYYVQVGKVLMGAAQDLGVPLEWGYELWNGWDAGHFQLPKRLFK